MLQKLEINNYQSHKHSVLNFHPNVNVIVGLSDAGKSAIIKALKWVISNRPNGDSFRSHWGGKTEVITTFNDCVISRSKDKENLYILNNLEFRAFGTNIPQEIINALNISDVNVQYQLDPHFLLSNSPGEVAQHFNKVAKLDKIDLAQSNIANWIRGITKDIETKKELISSNETQLTKYTHLEKFEAEVEVLEDLERKETIQIQKIAKLSSLLIQLEQIDIGIQDQQEYLNAEAPVKSVLELITKRDEIIQNKKKMVLLLDSLVEIKEDIAAYEEIIPAGDLIDELLELSVKKSEISKNTAKMTKLYNDVDLTGLHIITAEKEYNKLHKEFEKAMGDTCLLCGSKLK
ncbi:MAG: AAA family ATPase [Clostridia bacterium]